MPVCLHNFLSAAREAGIPLERYLTEPEAAARAHLQAVETYGYDCILIDLDTTMLAEAMGARRDNTPGEPVQSPPRQSVVWMKRRSSSPWTRNGTGGSPCCWKRSGSWPAPWADRWPSEATSDQCAFSLAGLLRGMEDFLCDLVSEPDHPGLQRLLEVSYQSHLATHRAVRRAGADFTSLGDSPAGPDVVSPAIFKRLRGPTRSDWSVTWPPTEPLP